MSNAVPSYKPSSYFYRAALRAAPTREEAIEVGMHMACELEALKAWVRERGLHPPKWFLMQSEIDEKNWGVLVQVDLRLVGGLPPSPDAEL